MRWIDLTSLYLFGGFATGFVLLVLLIGRYGKQYKAAFDHSVGRELGRAFVFISPSRLFALNGAIVIVCALAVFLVFRSPWPVLLVALAMSVLPKVALRHFRHQRIQRFRHQLPELISVLAGGIRAGGSLNGALGEVAAQMPAPAGQEIALVLRESRMGSTLEQAIGGLESRLPAEETMLLVSALHIGNRSGGSVAPTLDSLAQAMRRKLVLEAKIRALTAQGRLQAWVMALLPFLVLAAMLSLDPTLITVYFGTMLGWMVIGVVTGLQAVGGYLIRRMIHIEI